MSYFLAFLSALPTILAIIQAIMVKVNAAEQRGLGRKEAVAEALTIAHSQIETGNKVEAEAMASHAKDKTDTAFDQDFREG